jgi:hypothetical protein
MADTTNTVETNGTPAESNGTGTVNRVKAKPAGSFLSRLHSLADKSLPESTMLRRAGADGLTYTVRVPAVPPALTTEAIADVARGAGARVRAAAADGASSSWGVSGDNAAETVRRIASGE